MKEKYQAPIAEKIEFNYQETVVASGGDNPVASQQNQNKCPSLNYQNGNKCVG